MPKLGKKNTSLSLLWTLKLNFFTMPISTVMDLLKWCYLLFKIYKYFGVHVPEIGSYYVSHLLLDLSYFCFKEYSLYCHLIFIPEMNSFQMWFQGELMLLCGKQGNLTFSIHTFFIYILYVTMSWLVRTGINKIAVDQRTSLCVMT